MRQGEHFAISMNFLSLENWPWIAASLLIGGYAGWFFLSGEAVGSVRGTASGPWGRTHTARVSVRRGGEVVRIVAFGSSALVGVWLTRAEALQCADALEKAAREAVS
jgi:hypothetical protein